MKKKIYFRDDDVDELNENLIKLIDVFCFYEIPLHLSVIPQALTEECADFLRKRMAETEGTLEVGQHGYSHTNHSLSRNRFGKYEFGEVRAYEEQKSDILKGREIVAKQFLNHTDIFTPPWHGFDLNTVKVLSEEGFRALSCDSRNAEFFKKNFFPNIPVHINFNQIKEDGSWKIQDNQRLIKSLYHLNDNTIGVLFHHKTFNNDGEFKQLEKFLEFIKKNKIVETVPLSRVLEDKNNTQVNIESLAYFLNYQFIPKPFVLTDDSENEILEEFDFLGMDCTENSKEKKNLIEEELYSHLGDAIQRQLPEGNQPVGVLLSGGLDSAAILHLLRERTDRKIYTLSAAYRQGASNLLLAEKMAKHYGTIHRNLVIKASALTEMEELYRKGIPQPIGDNGFLSAHLMIKELRKSVDCVFAGDGADVLFSGLDMHERYLNQKEELEYEHYQYDEIFLTQAELPQVFGKTVENISLKQPFQTAAEAVRSGESVKRQILLDLNFLVRNRVDYIVCAAKANGAHIKLPYLDKELVSFVLRAPAECLDSNRQGKKRLLKNMFEGKLFDEVLNRKKEGFSPPFKEWYFKNKRFVIKKLLQTRNFGISSDYVLSLLRNMRKCDNYQMGMRIWLLINFSCWIEHN